MIVQLTDRAKADLRNIQVYIAGFNVSAAARVASRIRGSIAMLTYHPKLGHMWDEGPTRALAVPQYPYRIHYYLDDEATVLTVLTIQHTSQKPPTFS
jgi:plasmid stabilization system protein ParE